MPRCFQGSTWAQRLFESSSFTTHVSQSHHTFLVHRLSQQILLSNQIVGFKFKLLKFFVSLNIERCLVGPKKNTDVSGVAAGWKFFLMKRLHCQCVIFFTCNEHMSLLVITFFIARLILKKIISCFICSIIFIKIHCSWFWWCFFYLKYVYFIKIAKWILQCLLSCLFRLFIHFYKV